LSADAETIYQRTKNSFTRPLLNVENPKEKIKEILDQRMPFYAQMQFQIDTSSLSIEEVVSKIIQIIGENNYV